MTLKRLFDLLFSLLGLILLSPLFLFIAVLIKLDSSGPVFFRQVRIGLHQRPFLIHKYRTMSAHDPVADLQLTLIADPRITRIGRILRKYRLDELPQLIDVFLGRMSIVGPRPEVPRYVSYYPREYTDLIFSVRPGITDRSALAFKDEASLLAASSDPVGTYISEVIPVKCNYHINYVKTRTFLGDIRIIFDTFLSLYLK